MNKETEVYKLSIVFNDMAMLSYNCPPYAVTFTDGCLVVAADSEVVGYPLSRVDNWRLDKLPEHLN